MAVIISTIMRQNKRHGYCIGCSHCYAVFTGSIYIDSIYCLYCSSRMVGNEEQFCNNTCKRYFEIKYVNYLIKNGLLRKKDIGYLKKIGHFKRM